MSNILIYNLGYNKYSGGVYYIDGMACALALYGHNVTLLTNAHNASSFNLNYPNLERVIHPHYIPPDKKYDYIFSIHGNPMIISSIYAKARHIKFIPIVFELPKWVKKYIPNHPIDDRAFAYLREPLINSIEILCLAKECIRYIHMFSPETSRKPIYVIEGIINDTTADKVVKLNIQPEKKSVCWIGRHATHKRVTDLIKAISMLDDHKEWTINYVTPVLDNANIDIAKKLGIKLNIIVNSDDVQKFKIISQSNIVVSTSRFEGGVCMSILEALYMRRRVVSYNLPVHVDCCKDLITYTPMGNIRDMAIALNNMVNKNDGNDPIRIEKGRKFIENNFTIESFGRRLNDVLK